MLCYARYLHKLATFYHGLTLNLTKPFPFLVIYDYRKLLYLVNARVMTVDIFLDNFINFFKCTFKTWIFVYQLLCDCILLFNFISLSPCMSVQL